MSGTHFAAWRIAVWMLLLLAAFGILEYSRTIWMVWTAMGEDTQGAGIGAWSLAAYVAALLVTCLSLSAAAGTLLWREWARRLLRPLTVLLALFFLASGIWRFAQWQSFRHASAALLAQVQDPQAAQVLVDRVRRVMLMGLVLKAVAIPLLAWLAWRLGHADVRTQFRARGR